ncbi:MAG: arylamine N-acetyltransferase [Planctomycetia bacterium]|nr:arylamine N-acetyltransferase [Planctomycetia bacterium]
MATDLDLCAYLDRLGMPTRPDPTSAGLAELHLAHATHIPFENLDVLLSRPIRLDLESLQQKLVLGRRGGYCFEQNLLFASALETLGFHVTRLAARVRYRTTRLLARTHMLLRVETESGPYLADVGFGGSGPLLPLRLVADVEQKQFFWMYRLREENNALVLQAKQLGEWQDFYIFTREPQEFVDFVVANHYVSTHPDSPFTRTLVAQLPTPEARYLLRNREFTIERGTGSETRLVTDNELPEILAQRFGLTIPPGTKIPDQPWVWGSN